MSKNKIFQEGDIVFWNDPADETSAKYTIAEIDYFENTCLLVNDYSETEAYISELTYISIIK